MGKGQTYSDGVGRPSVPPGRYFRMLFVGQYEGLDSEREIAWRCADSLSLHRFLRLSDGETVPAHTTWRNRWAPLEQQQHCRHAKEWV